MHGRFEGDGNAAGSRSLFFLGGRFVLVSNFLLGFLGLRWLLGGFVLILFEFSPDKAEEVPDL